MKRILTGSIFVWLLIFLIYVFDLARFRVEEYFTILSVLVFGIILIGGLDYLQTAFFPKGAILKTAVPAFVAVLALSYFGLLGDSGTSGLELTFILKTIFIFLMLFIPMLLINRKRDNKM